MSRRVEFPLLAIALAGLFATGPALAEDTGDASSAPVDPATEPASEVLAGACRRFAACEGYSLSFSISLGLVSKGATAIASPLQSARHSGTVYRGILHLPGDTLYLTRSGGAAPDPTTHVWRKMSMFERCRNIAILLEMPDEHLGTALRFRSAARWAEGGAPVILVDVSNDVARTNLQALQNASFEGAGGESELGILHRVTTRNARATYRIELDPSTRLPVRIDRWTQVGVQFNRDEEVRAEMTYVLGRFGEIEPHTIPKQAAPYLR